MLLEKPEHVKRRKLMLRPVLSEQMQGYSETTAEVTRRELATRPRNKPFELWPSNPDDHRDTPPVLLTGSIEELLATLAKLLPEAISHLAPLPELRSWSGRSG